MNAECLSWDRISTLPPNIIESILSLMPIRDALRTSILSKKWHYRWRNMPKLVFTNNMVKVPSNCNSIELMKYKIVNAIFHVLLFHNGPSILEFKLAVGKLHMDSDVAQIISYLARNNTVKELNFVSTNNMCYKLPVSFFSLQGLELINLERCTFELPLTFNGFSCLKSMIFYNVEVSAQNLQRFLSKCSMLEHISLTGSWEHFDIVAGEDKFTFEDLLHNVPLIRSFELSAYYMEYLSTGGMPHKLITSLLHLKYLSLSVYVANQNEVFSALRMIRSSPVLEKIKFEMYGKEKLSVGQTPTNFLDPINYSDLKLDYLETFEIKYNSTLHFEMGFVKFIMANSPVLKKLQITLFDNVSVDEELKMFRDLVLLSFPRASSAAKLIIRRP